MTHSWTKQELQIVCVCYKHKLPIELALLLTNTTNAKSMEMRYQNCLFLEKGRVEGSLSHASKNLVEAWNEVNELLPNNPEEFDSNNVIMILFIISILVQLVTVIISIQ